MITPEQCRMARAALRLGVRELAEMASVSVMTITRFETGQTRAQSTNLQKLQSALEAAGVIFTESDGVAGPGVRLREKSGPDSVS